MRDDVATLHKLLPVAIGVAQFEASLNDTITLVNSTVEKIETVLEDFKAIDDFLPSQTVTTPSETSPTKSSSPTEGVACIAVNDILQEYDIILGLSIALTYAETDAIKLYEYYSAHIAL